MRNFLILASAAFALTLSPVYADDDDGDAGFGLAGLKSGTHYEIEIEADGSQELALAGAAFFRAIWINELVIEGIEIRPLGVDSFEFDEAGTLEMSFIAIKPGSYTLHVPQARGDLQTLEITIE